MQEPIPAHTILTHLVHNEVYGRKVLPFLKPEYFQDAADKLIFEAIRDYTQKYNAFPTKDVLYIELSNKTGLDELTFNRATGAIQALEPDDKASTQWLVDRTEQHCKRQAIYNAVAESIMVYDGKSKVPVDGLPKLFQDALQVSFDSHIGHDFLEDADARFDKYHEAISNRLTFDIDILNQITNGGLPDKTLTALMAPPGIGKSFVMCHMAAYNLLCNHNVLYITMEMAEERIAERIDANLLDVRLDDLQLLSRVDYAKKIERLKQTTKGKLIIKEYPTASAHSGHFRHLLNELRIKKNFVPRVIYIDYLNICQSARIKAGSQVNSYTYIKAIAEELRGLAVEFNLPIITATQANRAAVGASDYGMENTSDSLGLPQTLDLQLALISTEQLEQMNQLMWKQIKNRLGNIFVNTRFVTGIDRPKMRLINVKKQPTADRPEDKPVFDNTDVEQKEQQRMKKKAGKFKGFG